MNASNITDRLVLAIPFVILAALVAGTVITTRSAQAIHPKAAVARTIPTLPTVHVVARSPRLVQADTASMRRLTRIALSDTVACNWSASELWMPYFSYATPLLSNAGI